eukprot:6188219-Pleurochrysis_carterae.AAC.1
MGADSESEYIELQARELVLSLWVQTLEVSISNCKQTPISADSENKRLLVGQVRDPGGAEVEQVGALGQGFVIVRGERFDRA